MEYYYKLVAIVLIAVVLGLIVSKYGKDFSLLLSLFVVSLVLVGVIYYLEPVISFVNKLVSVGKIDSELFGVILKSVGIALIGELVSLICADSGQATLGKTAQILCTCVILWISLPVFTKLLDIIENILGAV